MNQGETWSVLSAPVHGTLAAGYTTLSTGGTLTPAGLSYIPGGYIGSDSFKVVISDCADLSDTTIVYVTAKACPLSVLNSAKHAGSIEIFPNPNSGTFSIYVSSATTGDAHIVISNMIDEKVKEINATTNAMTDIQLTVPEGIYFCNVITKDGNYMEKVLIFK